MSFNYDVIDVNQCPICKSPDIKVILEELTDDVANALEFSAHISECQNCSHSFLARSLSDEYLSSAYAGYYTQKPSAVDESHFMGDARFSSFKSFYERKYKRQGNILSVIFNVPPLNFFLNRAVRFLPSDKTQKRHNLLDIGCGNGEFLYRVKDLGFEVTGLDFDKHAVQHAQKINLNVKIGSAETIDDKIQFDNITASHVIEHLRDPNMFLDTVYKLLNDGGYFYLATPNFNSLGRHSFGKKWRGVDFPRHLHFFNYSGLYRLLKEKGFSRVEPVNDIAQSFNIFKTSIHLKNKETSISLIKKIGLLIKFLSNNLVSPKKSEVIVFRCWK